MDLNEVAVFVKAATVGSLAAAARGLGIAPMVASRRLAALEAELGARLIHRTTRAFALTAEGDAFLPHARALIEGAAAGKAAVRPCGPGGSGLLRLTASLPFGRKVLVPMIPAFLGTHPGLEVDLVLSDYVLDIVAQGIDLAVRIAPLRDNGLIARKLVDSARDLYAAPSYIAKKGAPTCLADLADHDCLPLGGATHWHFIAKGRRISRRITGRFTTNALDAVHQACLGGLGIANLSAWNVRDDLAAGRLLALPLDDAWSDPLNIWAVYPTTRLVPPKVRLFIDALSAHLHQP